jgi:hypothetical protein
MLPYPHMKPLTPPGELIVNSWKTFVKSWSVMVPYSAWFILIGILQAAMMFIPQDSFYFIAGFALLIIVASVVITLWPTICLYQLALKMEAGATTVTEQINKNAWMLAPSLLLVMILNGLATFGATLLLIIPGIYVGIRLGFSTVSLIDKNLKGRAALANSWALTKDRFWVVLGYQILAGFIFGAAISILAMFSMGIIGLIAGAAKLGYLFSATQTPVANAFNSVIQSILQAAFMPLILIFQVKLYRSLVDSQQQPIEPQKV